MNFKAIHLWNSWSLHPHIHACSSVHRMFHLKADYVVFPWQVSERVSLLVSLLVDLLSIFCKPALLPRCKHNPEYERLTGWVFFFLSKGEKKKKSSPTMAAMSGGFDIFRTKLWRGKRRESEADTRQDVLHFLEPQNASIGELYAIKKRRSSAPLLWKGRSGRATTTSRGISRANN